MALSPTEWTQPAGFLGFAGFRGDLLVDGLPSSVSPPFWFFCLAILEMKRNGIIYFRMFAFTIIFVVIIVISKESKFLNSIVGETNFTVKQGYGMEFLFTSWLTVPPYWSKFGLFRHQARKIQWLLKSRFHNWIKFLYWNSVDQCP